MSYALPACRSNFSLLWGTAFPEQLIERAAACGVEHLGLADNDNLYAATDFYRGCRDAGINPLLGIRLTTELGQLHLIAADYGGYQNLCRLVTLRQLADMVSPADLANHRDSVLCLAPVGCDFGQLREIYGSDIYLALSGREDRRVEQIVVEYGVRPVASPSVSFLEREDYRFHRLLRAIDVNALVEDLNGTPGDDLMGFFPDRSEVTRRFRHIPEAVAEAHILGQRCQVNFPPHRWHLPEHPGIDGDKAEQLRQKVCDSLAKKKGHIGGAYQARLDFELEVIARTGFTDYFLIVSGIVDHCRQRGLPIVGRGSAAGSLVAYSLDITQVDPIREKLYFERFLNEARSDPPDIDLDIDWRRRDDVIDYIYDTYGHDRVAMMATYVRFRARMAVREIAKARGLDPEEINRFAKRLPHVNPGEIERAVKDLPPSFQADLRRFGPILIDAGRLDNFPRHLGIHCGGIVITPGPITDYVALERATKGIVITQCDMYQAEKTGLIKIDILGQRGFAVIVDCLEHARQVDGPDFEIPEYDDATYDLLRSGKTIGAFQIESPGLRAVLRDLQPMELNDITLALAVIRPGASDSGMKKNFLDRHHGLEEVSYPDRRLAEVLAETHGVFIYQEQVLLCAREIAGFNLPAADLLRRAMTKDRTRGRIRQLFQRFLDGAIANGVSVETAGRVFQLLMKFAGFGFCKAHAATYAFLAYQSAYFKVHYPHVFIQSVINNGGGYYPVNVYIEEARRMGLAIKPPDINISGENVTLHDNALYLGLDRVRELEFNTINQVLTGRPYASFDDFLSRVRLQEIEAENLIKAGSFDAIEEDRSRLLWRLRLRGGPSRGTRSGKSRDGDDLFGGRMMIPRAKKLPRFNAISEYDRFRYERDVLGISASAHPLEILPAFKGEKLAERIHRFQNGDRAVFNAAAWLVDVKRIRTREKKEPMVFLTFEDLDDTFEVVLFPDVYHKFAEVIRGYRYLHISGAIAIDGGNTSVVAERVVPAPTGLSFFQPACH